MGLGAVLHQSNIPVLADLLNGGKREGLAVEVDSYHRFGPGGDPLLQVVGIDIECSLIHIGKDRPQPLIEGAVGCGDEGEGRGDDLRSRLQLQGFYGQVQSNGAIVHRNGILDTQICGKPVFEFLDCFSLGQHSRFQHLFHCIYLFLADDGLGYGNKISHQDLLLTLNLCY